MAVLVLLANGFEEIEALTVINILRRGKVEAYTVSTTNELILTGSNGIKVVADMLFDEADFTRAEYVVLPGGLKGTNSLKANELVVNLIKERVNKQLGVAAICAAPTLLVENGLLDGKDATSYPSFHEVFKPHNVNYLDEKVVVLDNIITSRSMYTSIDFALEILRKVTDDITVEEVKDSIIYNDK